MSFISPSPSLFSLLPPPPPAASTSTSTPLNPLSTYAILNSPSSTEAQIEEEIERVANGLFSAVATSGLSLLTLLSHSFQSYFFRIGHVPFIRAPRGNAAEMIAKKLETKIRDVLLSASRTHASASSLFAQDSTGFSTLQRPRKLHHLLASTLFHIYFQI